MRAAGSRRKVAKPETNAAPGAAKPARVGRGVSADPVKFDLVDLLGSAGWVEADQTLAASLRDFGMLEHAFRTLAAKARGGDLEPSVRTVEDALLLARQSLSYAGRKRGLQRFGQVGAVEPFDPRLHTLIGARAAGIVRIKVQGVARGSGPHADILVKAEVAAVRPRKPGLRASGVGAARPGA